VKVDENKLKQGNYVPGAVVVAVIVVVILELVVVVSACNTYVVKPIYLFTRNSSGDKIANVNILYDDVHALKIQYILA